LPFQSWLRLQSEGARRSYKDMRKVEILNLKVCIFSQTLDLSTCTTIKSLKSAAFPEAIYQLKSTVPQHILQRPLRGWLKRDPDPRTRLQGHFRLCAPHLCIEDHFEALFLLVPGLNVMNCKSLLRFADLAQTRAVLELRLTLVWKRGTLRSQYGG
jgi:hypothetical protein